MPRILNVVFDRRPPKYKRIYVLLHGIGSTGHMWRRVENELPDNVRVIALDLVGFGDSPKPDKASYNVRLQARSVGLTLLRMRLRGRVIIIGHSMGSLIAIEFARRYPLLVRGLLLISPPIYSSEAERRRKLPSSQTMLKRAYSQVQGRVAENPARILQLARTATKLGLAAEGFRLDHDTALPYAKALKSSIIDQSSYRHIVKIKRPVEIIYGSLDPFVIPANFKKITAQNPQVHATRIIAMHDVTGRYLAPIRRAVSRLD